MIVNDMADQLVQQGVAAIMPACSELPLILCGECYKGLPLVDPVLGLAIGLVCKAISG